MPWQSSSGHPPPIWQAALTEVFAARNDYAHDEPMQQFMRQLLHVKHDLTRDGPLAAGDAVPLDVPLHMLGEGAGTSSVGAQVAAAAGRPLVLVAGSWS